MGHQHNSDPARGPVCSQFVTDEMQVAWGLQVERTEKIVGSKTVTRPGISAREAIWRAWCEGRTVVCTRRPAVTPAWRMDPAHAADAVAWVAAHRRTA